MTIVNLLYSVSDFLTGAHCKAVQDEVEKRVADLHALTPDQAKTEIKRLRDQHLPELMVALKWRATPLLHEAAAKGWKGVVQVLLEMTQSDIDAPDQDGNTPLMCAAKEGHLDVARALLAAHASTQTTNHTGCTALILAAATGIVDLVKPLLGNAVIHDVNARDQNGNTALMTALLHGHVDVAKFLVVRGYADVTLVNDHGQSPLDVAASLGDGDLVALLCGFGARADVNVLAPDGNSPLISATKVYNTRADAHKKAALTAVDVLIGSKAKVDLLDKDGRTALFHALRYKDTAVAEKLIQAGARLNAMSGATVKELIQLDGFDDEVVQLLRPQFVAMDSEQALDLMRSKSFALEKIGRLFN